MGVNIMATIPSDNPPSQGYALQYELLYLEEKAIHKLRSELSQSLAAGTPPNMDRINILNVRSMIHRVSLERMLQCAAANDSKDAVSAELLWEKCSRELDEVIHFVIPSVNERRGLMEES